MLTMSTYSRPCGCTDRRVGNERGGAVFVEISTPTITLGDFLKWAGAAPTGGAAKVLAREGRVVVNGATERRRGRRLGPGDLVGVGGREYRVVAG